MPAQTGDVGSRSGCARTDERGRGAVVTMASRGVGGPPTLLTSP